MLLGQFFAIRAAHQRRVQVAQRGYAQRVLQQDLARRVVGQVFATHHVGDALGGVIDHHRQLIRPQAISAAQHKVAHGVADVLLLRTQAAVVPVQHLICSAFRSY